MIGKLCAAFLLTVEIWHSVRELAFSGSARIMILAPSGRGADTRISAKSQG